ncbi:MAG: hypothetical protein ACM3MH_12470 [Actinomycetota bacterium]
MDQPLPIQGVWTGFYMCSQGAAGFLLTITGDDLAKLTARFRFFAFPENPNVQSGEFELTGSFDPPSGRLELAPSRWIDRPDGYAMVGIKGSIQPDRTIQGTIDAPGCTRFAMYKKSAEGEPSTATMLEAILTLSLLATPLALLVSLFLLWLYLRAVKRTMARRATTAPSGIPSASVAPVNAAPPSPLEIATTDAAWPPSANHELRWRTMMGPWRAAGVYTAAGLGCAATLAAAFVGTIGSGFTPFKFLLFTLYFAWPVVLTIGIVAINSWRAWLLVASLYLLTLAPIVAIELHFSERFTTWQAVELWFLFNLPGNLIALTSLTRRIRAVGPMVLGILVLAIGGGIASYVLIGSGNLFRRLMLFGLSLGLEGLAPFYALGVIAAILLGLLGWACLRGLGVLYSKRWINDQTLAIDSIWLAFVLATALTIVEDGWGWFALALAGIAVYKITALLGFALVRRRFPGTALDPKLLLLRVFALGKRSEQLFDAFGKPWRYVGSIRFIAGPDLATSTIEPHEFLDFLTGKLARRFISSSDALARRLAETEPRRDFDGRYRVSEFLCHDDTWKMALGALARDSDAVLMDLRGFSPGNSGCIFEINELLNVMPLDRVVFVIDETTDQAFLHDTLSQAWQTVGTDSPNRTMASPRAVFFRLRQPREVVPKLVDVVMAAALVSKRPAAHLM